MKAHHFHTQLPYQKPMLRQTEWWVQNGPITKNGVLPETPLFFWKFSFSLRTCYRELIWYTNNPNTHIPTFCKRWDFIWRCFFPVSILKSTLDILVWRWNSFWPNLIVLNRKWRHDGCLGNSIARVERNCKNGTRAIRSFLWNHRFEDNSSMGWRHSDTGMLKWLM